VYDKCNAVSFDNSGKAMNTLPSMVVLLVRPCLEHLVIYNHCLSDNVRIFRSTLETIGKGCPKLKHLAMGPCPVLDERRCMINVMLSVLITRVKP
jgi:hypothetical protein